MSAIILYIIGITSLAILCVLYYRAVSIYRDALDKAPLHAKKEQIKAEIEHAQHTLSDIKAEIKEIFSQQSVAQAIIEKSKIEKEWLDENENKISQLKQQIESTNQNLKDTTFKYAKSAEELTALELKVQDEKSSKQSLELALEGIQQKTDQLTSTIDAQTQRLSHLDADVAKKQEDLSKIIAEYNTYEAKQKALYAEISNLENKKNEASHKLEKITETYDKTNDEILKNKKSLHELTDQVNAKFVESGQNKNKNKWEDLERPFFPSITSAKKNQEEEQTWLSEFKENLDTYGIKFNGRMINAFHTSLKVEDSSPLVVLAGISGTGKSLLPKLYAKAIGMNFMQVAVQPRWDSPQDMLGFYNYMENRFKATELSRLLWQYDIFNNQKAKETYYKNKDKLPMNLVLLDEMNLARVEYYFSDMLSKLEVRRGIDEDDDNQRKSSEIEIECGASNKEAQPRNLYIGKNTLFVGTMNEDESTQSLSDKVMDRANMIRFGRPKELNAHPNQEAFKKKYKDRFISQSQWQNKWINDDNNNIGDKLGKIMTPINDLLANIGRPFAHRVWLSMKHYVKNYPVLGDDGFNQAVADQIEMKILPKLSGLEKTDSTIQKTLQELKNQIHPLKDQDLYDAFERTLNDDSKVFFQWKGVMR